MYIVELEKGVWLDSPDRTIVKKNAKRYETQHGAKTALGIAVSKLPSSKFPLTAVIEKVEDEDE